MRSKNLNFLRLTVYFYIFLGSELWLEMNKIDFLALKSRFLDIGFIRLNQNLYYFFYIICLVFDLIFYIALISKDLVLLDILDNLLIFNLFSFFNLIQLTFLSQYYLSSFLFFYIVHNFCFLYKNLLPWYLSISN